MCDHLYQVFVKLILLQSSFVVFAMQYPLLFVSKGRGFFWVESLTGILGDKNQPNEKSLGYQGFFFSISMPPAGIEPATHGLRVRCSAS